VQEIAQELGYEYVSVDDPKMLRGNFCQVGHSQEMTDVIYGKYKDLPVRVFSYKYTVGYGKNSHTYYMTVFEMAYNAHLPHVIMNNYGKTDIPTDGTEKVELEGNFNTVFSLHVEIGKQLEIREIFTPDIMEEAMENVHAFSMEIAESYVYLFQSGVLTNKQTVLNFMAAADNFYIQLLPALSSVARDAAVSAAQPALPG